MKPSKILEQCGIVLPRIAKPVGAYVPAVRTGNLIYTSGQLPIGPDGLAEKGNVSRYVSVESANAAARLACLNALSAIAGMAGSIDKIKQIVRLNVFVNSDAGFTDQASVANGASELLHKLFGSAGQHTRCAIGVAELPLDAPVELDLIVEVQD